MVRNTKGGRNTKKGARKHLNDGGAVQKMRYADPKEPCEMYARVLKLYGFGICEVICNDCKIRQCIIRNKFRGRNKRSNNISDNTKVLVGLRDWEVLKEGKKEKCDLLEVYNSRQESELKNDKNCNWKIIGGEIEERNDEENYEFVEELVDDKKYGINVEESNDNEFNFEDVDIDDI
jgi:translation initiation factor IF-1